MPKKSKQGLTKPKLAGKVSINEANINDESDDNLSVDLSAMDHAETLLGDAELFEILAGKHRFQDVGKILHVGIIDYLTRFTCMKKAELKVKSCTAVPQTISVQHPTFYGDRFMDFMTNYVLKNSI